MIGVGLFVYLFYCIASVLEEVIRVVLRLWFYVL